MAKRLRLSTRGLSKMSTVCKGAVVGMFESADEKTESVDESLLSTAATHFNKISDGQLIKQLNFGKPLKAGDQRILYGLSTDYNILSVVGLGKRGVGYCSRELLHEGKENTRRAASAGVLGLRGVGVTNADIDSMGYPEAAAEGALLTQYVYDVHKNEEQRDKTVAVELLALNEDDEQTSRQAFSRGRLMAECQNLARELQETPANLLTPEAFAERAKQLFADSPGVTVTAHDEEWARKEGMNAFLAVSKGSSQPGVFLEINIEPAAKIFDPTPIVIVGKGVTFDSGGISLKSPAGMDTMRGDMGGAAVALAAGYGVVKSMRGRRRVVLLLPMVENMPGAGATRPGDIVTARNGKTIKIDNTDAEGRLILADALSYADTFNPEMVIDMATLTGAVHMALGSSASAVFTNNDELWETLQKEGADAGDRFWRLPLFKHFSNKLKTDSADLDNISKPGVGGHASIAAAFLKEFTKCEAWAHIDIAGVTEMIKGDNEVPYLSKGMTGRPTRAILNWLLSR